MRIGRPWRLYTDGDLCALSVVKLIRTTTGTPLLISLTPTVAMAQVTTIGNKVSGCQRAIRRFLRSMKAAEVVEGNDRGGVSNPSCPIRNK